MNVEAPLAFNPMDPDLAANPYPAYKELREADPVHQSPLGFWVLTRYAEVAVVLGDAETYQHCYAQTQQARLGDAVAEEPYFSRFQRMIFVMDQPRHPALRKYVQGSLVQRLPSTRRKLQSIAEALLDKYAAERRMELIGDFALQLPKSAIGDLLGVPEEDHDSIAESAAKLSPTFEFLPMGAETLASVNESILVLEDYFRDLLAHKRKHPGEDHLTDLLAAIDAPDGMTEDEAISNAILMYIAGHDTTTGAIGIVMLSLHRNPDQWKLLTDDPSLARSAVDELLRYDTPGQATARVAMRDVELGGKQVPQGSMILFYIGAANHDPAVFENPDQLNILVGKRRPITFGGGPHICVGQSIAKTEIQIALENLATGCPGMQLETLNPEFRPTNLMRCIKSLNVTW